MTPCRGGFQTRPRPPPNHPHGTTARGSLPCTRYGVFPDLHTSSSPTPIGDPGAADRGALPPQSLETNKCSRTPTPNVGASLVGARLGMGAATPKPPTTPHRTGTQMTPCRGGFQTRPRPPPNHHHGTNARGSLPRTGYGVVPVYERLPALRCGAGTLPPPRRAGLRSGTHGGVWKRAYPPPNLHHATPTRYPPTRKRVGYPLHPQLPTGKRRYSCVPNTHMDP